METQSVPEKTRFLKLISYKRKLVLGAGGGHDLFKNKLEGGPFDRIADDFKVCKPEKDTKPTQVVVYQAIKSGVVGQFFWSLGIPNRHFVLTRAQINDFVSKYNGCLGYHYTLFLFFHDGHICSACVELGSSGQMNTWIGVSLKQMIDDIITEDFKKDVHIVVPISAF